MMNATGSYVNADMTCNMIDLRKTQSEMGGSMTCTTICIWVTIFLLRCHINFNLASDERKRSCFIKLMKWATQMQNERSHKQSLDVTTGLNCSQVYDELSPGLSQYLRLRRASCFSGKICDVVYHQTYDYDDGGDIRDPITRKINVCTVSRLVQEMLDECKFTVGDSIDHTPCCTTITVFGHTTLLLCTISGGIGDEKFTWYRFDSVDPYNGGKASYRGPYEDVQMARVLTTFMTRGLYNRNRSTIAIEMTHFLGARDGTQYNE